MTTIENLAKVLLYSHCLYEKGNSVIILEQRASPIPSEYEHDYTESQKICELLYKVYSQLDVNVQHIIYENIHHQNGVDAPKELYDLDCNILLMPTAFSLTHTPFRKHMTAKGTKIMSMPGFTVEYLSFLEDTTSTTSLTLEYYEKLKTSQTVHITGEKTDIFFEINPELVLKSIGFVDEDKDNTGQVPGAETYCVPKNANGYFTIPKGFGGSLPVKHDVMFTIKDGRFVDFIGQTPDAQKYIDSEIKPLFTKPNYNVVAELGIGTNPNITIEYIQKTGWSTLLAEKIFGTAHIANGNSKAMGGDNDVPIHIDWVIPDVKIEFC